ncbi:MAG: carbohydrate ABC transporter permease, partial [Bacteroidetes bacterium]|nr:carbohydrate ABC transporter permease [Bacteroidota bacterium]
MKRIIFYILLIAGALIFLYPFIWMVLASLSPENQIGNLTFIPTSLTFDSYSQMLSKIPIGRSFINSLFVSSAVTFGVLVFGSMVGYALSKLEFKGRNLIFYVIIFTMTLP